MPFIAVKIISGEVPFLHTAAVPLIDALNGCPQIFPVIIRKRIVRRKILERFNLLILLILVLKTGLISDIILNFS